MSSRAHAGNAMPTLGLSVESSSLAPRSQERNSFFVSKLVCDLGQVALPTKSQSDLPITDRKGTGAKQPPGPSSGSEGLATI